MTDQKFFVFKFLDQRFLKCRTRFYPNGLLKSQVSHRPKFIFHVYQSSRNIEVRNIGGFVSIQMTCEDRNKGLARADDLFSGRGPPAFMSEKEPAIRMLRQRYSESFALTQGSMQGQVHLFLIKLGMWALVWTFTGRDTGSVSETEKFGIEDALQIIESTFKGESDSLQKKLDKAVSQALERIQSKLDEVKTASSRSHNF